ncbi:VWFA and cache domain-containing protein CG16868 [Anastrepha ludens]|uniref:VWFA and cache domain-containing protein CG16868 n=1 Tax=Anastrepha ludens TaxID=28586 RepID=UPI0023AF0DF5|nr:VWFA and cache domain-containing protein CG16868 [Anastrepha ludens]XP_053963185.1 VWFA and cache domain-containing protein CG16868 [Anastrepha ludens]
MDRIFILFLLFSCDAVVLDKFNENETAINSHTNSNVPVLLSNISLHTNLSVTTQLPTVAKDFVTVNVNTLPLPVSAAGAGVSVAPQKVPLRRNTSESSIVGAMGVTSPFAQTSTSVFFANYHNQQNVLELVRNIDTRLRIIRNVEMRVATIQELFDSMHFSSNGAAVSINIFKNNSETQHNSASATLQRDLQLFSKRLAKKLQKATHMVLELRDFFRFNITKVLLQQHLQATEYGDISEDKDSEEEESDADEEEGVSDDDSEEDEFDIEIDDLDGLVATGHGVRNLHMYLHTCIQGFQPITSESKGFMTTESNYNKKQIQILNYLKTDSTLTQTHKSQFYRQFDMSNYFMDEGSFEARANAYILEKLQTLKNALMKSDFSIEHPKMSSNVRSTAPTITTTTNTKLKFLGNHFKHIFFLSRSDHADDLRTRYYTENYFQQLYVSSIKNKYVFLLLDVGSAMNMELLELTKALVTNILQLLSPTDLISIATVTDEAHIMQFEPYPNDMSTSVFYATRPRKEEILNHIHSLVVTNGQTNHSLGFEYAFKVIHQLQNSSIITEQNPIQFVYATRGLLTNLSDTMHVLQVIANGQRQLIDPIVIHTCAVVTDEKRIMYEKQFLTDIATQNYTKYKIPVNEWCENDTDQQQLAGKFFVLTKAQMNDLMRLSVALFQHTFRERYLSESLEVQLPVVEPNSQDSIISVTHAVPPFGVVGVNLYLADLIEDVISYGQPAQNANKNEFNYAFLIDRNGITIAHPAFPRPMAQQQTPFPVDIGFLENSTDFAYTRRLILHDEMGNITTSVYLTRDRKIEAFERIYQWQSILGIYILCLVSTYKPETSSSNSTTPASTDNAIRSATLQAPPSLPLSLQRFSVPKDNVPRFHHNDYEYLSSMELLYHRLDLVPPPNGQTCRYFRQVATTDAPTLFLSASAFMSPFTFLHNNRVNSPGAQIRTVESIMAYLKDTTGLLANPGLRPQIRHEVNALYSAMQHLKKRHQDARGTLKNYIIRRYIATVNGVLQVFPGCLLSTNYDPTRRPWFRRALLQPGKIITTEPYLDAGGAGYIITIAHTIFEGKSNALHSVERDQPVAIVALDLPYAYYYKMILDSTPLCHMKHIKCLLFENEGYLIAHPSMLEPSSPARNQRRPHEHLTHKESYLANDILNHKSLMRKLACANYQNRTLQRYYVFNTSLGDILTNVVHGERTKYAIALVYGSNIFAAVLNSTCDGGAFCPCSTIDRVCLNCNRMDQMDCECPCECPMEMEVFNGVVGASHPDSSESNAERFVNYTQQFSYCEPPSEHFIALPPVSADHQLLHSCVNINCDVYGTQNECLAVMGCEWCQQDVDGNSFTTSFCAAQVSCFNGVLSSLTPYGDLDDVDIIAAHTYNPGQKPNTYSAFGPVGGAIIVLGIVIGFAIYCYRHNMDTQSQEQFYMDSMQEENYGLPLSRFNFDDCQAHDDPPGGNGGYDHPSAQRNLMHPADISPYHMSTGSSYRRPPNGESDHGYSTMTPHEDSSDHQCFALAEPLLLHDKRNSKSDTMSISTSISSPTNRHHQPHNPNPYLNHPMPTPAQAKDVVATRYQINSPKKFQQVLTPARHIGDSGPAYGQTTLPLTDSAEEYVAAPRYILAPVTVHRHMEPTET